jgi:transposase-like protein
MLYEVRLVHRRQRRRHILVQGDMENVQTSDRLISMRKSDVTCPKCHAGYRRIELTSMRGVEGEYRCLVCDQVLELLDGSTEVALRLTVQPSKTSYAY